MDYASDQWLRVSVDSSLLRPRGDRVKGLVAQAATDTVAASTRAAEKALEQATAAGGGRMPRIALAWQSEVWPKQGRSYSPIGTLWTKGLRRKGAAIRAHSEGATIRAGGGNWLAIPTRYAGAREQIGFIIRRFGPKEWSRRTGIDLAFVRLPDGRAYLGARGRVVAGNFVPALADPGRDRRLARTMRGFAEAKVGMVPIFWLQKSVTLKKRIELLGAIAPIAAQIPQAILNKMKGIDQ